MEAVKSPKSILSIAMCVGIMLILLSGCGSNQASLNPNNPFRAEECIVGEVKICNTSTQELIDNLGTPDEESFFENEIPVDYFLYRYGNVHFLSSIFADGIIDFVKIYGETDMKTPRDIHIGDTFESVLAKFPKEKDYNVEPDGSFYGEDTLSGAGGSVSHGEEYLVITVTSEHVSPFMKIYFDPSDKKVSSIHIGNVWN